MQAASDIEVSVIIPSFNEAENVGPITAALTEVLTGRFGESGWEIIWVDDNSPDGTAAAVRAMAKTDRRIRIMQRVGRRGLSSAVMDGIMSAAGEICVIMDGDGQHDPAALPDIVAPIILRDVDVVAASRFIGGGDAGGLSSQARKTASLKTIRLINKMFHLSLTDPLTGYFAISRERALEIAPSLSQYGFKILVDLIVSGGGALRVKEIPLTFKPRAAGESKLGNRVIFDFFLFMIEKTLGRFISVSPRFISFALIGGSGVFLHLAVMAMIFAGARLASGGAEISPIMFTAAQFGGALCAMFSNYFLNNLLTYADRRLSGFAFVKGFILFALLCSVGLAANVGVASAINSRYATLWALSALGGILVGTVWNYAATRQYVWKASE